MSTILLSVQLALLVVALPLLVASLKTTRALRSRHAAFLSVAVVVSVAAALLAVVSLAFVLDQARPLEAIANFVPPLVTIVCSVVIGRRAVAAIDGTARRQARERRAAARAAGVAAEPTPTELGPAWDSSEPGAVEKKPDAPRDVEAPARAEPARALEDSATHATGGAQR